MKQSSRWDLLPGNGQDRFGSRVGRFNEKPIGVALGPGQYQDKYGVGRAKTGILGKAASSAFKGEERKGVFKVNAGAPGPGDYLNDRNFAAWDTPLRSTRWDCKTKRRLLGSPSTPNVLPRTTLYLLVLVSTRRLTLARSTTRGTSIMVTNLELSVNQNGS